jgi:hypothetical protein
MQKRLRLHKITVQDLELTTFQHLAEHKNQYPAGTDTCTADTCTCTIFHCQTTGEQYP